MLSIVEIILFVIAITALGMAVFAYGEATNTFSVGARQEYTLDDQIIGSGEKTRLTKMDINSKSKMATFTGKVNPHFRDPEVQGLVFIEFFVGGRKLNWVLDSVAAAHDETLREFSFDFMCDPSSAGHPVECKYHANVPINDIELVNMKLKFQ